MWKQKRGKNACKVNGTINVRIAYIGILLTILLLSSAASAASGVKTILVQTNRFSVQTFNNATVALSGYDADNSTFTFTAGALVMGTNGLPVSGENVLFEIRNASGGLKASGTKVTAPNGLAFFAYNTYGVFTSDSDSDYGAWTIKASLVSNTSINRSVIVNLTDQNYINGCSRGYCHHNPSDLSTLKNTVSSPRSPYSDKFGSAPSTMPSMAYGAMVVMSSRQCVICHPGYGYPISGDDGHTRDYHSSFQCSDSRCHGAEGTWPVPIPSCFNANCHPISNKNLTNFTTLANISGISNTTIYSTTVKDGISGVNTSKTIPYAVHNSSQYSNITGVPCWICHGPMHNITRPDPLNPTQDNITEDSQCIVCHTTYNEHNSSNITSGGINCTFCHSQDAHTIKVFAQNASYIYLNRNNPNPARGNCTNCHQNSTFFNILKAQPKAGNYTGRNPPQVQVPLNHSNDSLAGKKWNQTPGYWTNGTSGSAQYTACIYCHNDTKHNTTALGRASQFDGTNTVGSLISSSSNWCASCHWQGYSSGANTYNDMVNTFKGTNLTVPPEISGNATYAPTAKPGYTNHSSYNKYDSSCKLCHGSLTTSNNITGLMHNVAQGLAGGGDCAQCHPSYVSAVNSSQHNQTLNASAPTCTSCHIGYDSQHSSFIVNGTNTCTKSGCHAGKDVTMGSSNNDIADCTDCHFANTTQPFSLDASLSTHDHNLTVEHNFYNYNISGIPLSTNNGTGLGMFPYYTCTLTCHNGVEQPSIEDKVIAWNESKHARSREGTSDSNAYCAKCKSPPNYNLSADKTYNASANYSRDFSINASDWQGIQCRICHNLHNDSYSTPVGGFPLAFYNTTATLQTGRVVYDKVPNSTVLCQNCHTTATHDSKYAGYHKDTLGFTCADCHVNSTINGNLTHTFEVKNTTTNVTGCEVCHNPADHTFRWTSKHTDKVTCEACHDKTVARNATGYAVNASNEKVTNVSAVYGIYEDQVTGLVSSYKDSHGIPATWPLHNLSRNVSCDKCHGTYSLYNGTMRQDTLIAPSGPVTGKVCVECHPSYVSAVNNSMHNQTLNAAAPACTDCHRNYDTDTGHNGFIVNQSNTCVNCHIQGQNGFDFGVMKNSAGTQNATCTQCHFSNNTIPFEWNNSLLVHDHNLTIEHNYYYYNQSGTNQSGNISMPLKRNGGTGLGVFPYWSCSQSCHGGSGTNLYLGLDNASITWVYSKHAQSLVEPPLDQKQSCAKCKSPLNYNVSANSSELIPVADWQGIQCRICHDIMNIRYSNSTGGFPLAFYNATATSNKTTNPSGAAIYDQVHNATELCEKCHTGSSHDSKFAGTHKDTVGFDCASCHLNTTSASNGGFNNRSHSFEVMNAYTGVRGCEVCHNYVTSHTNFTQRSNHDNKVTCEACHDKTVSRNATGYAANGNYGLYNDTATGLVSSYKGGASAPSTWPLHNISKEVSCDKCHGTKSPVTNQVIAPDFGNGSCISCHDANGSSTSKIDTTAFGAHTKINNTDAGLTDSDCQTCHFNTTGMGAGYNVQLGVNVYTCLDCHISGNYSAPIISNHRPPSVPVSPGASITTGAYCTICHNNSINTYIYSVNASVSHYGTNSSLIKPTVNQTSMPRFGFMTPSDAQAYNTECTNCHNPSNASYGNATQILVAHTSLGTCKECHVNASASDLHNGSLGIPQTFGCLDCHTTFASKYSAPNLTGTSMTAFTNCEGCHGGGNGNQLLDSPSEHNINRYQNGYTPAGPGLTDTVYLNGQVSLTVTKGTIVTITSRVNDTPGSASRVGGAEYYVDTNPGVGRGIPMDPANGVYDAANGIWENVSAIINTSTLSEGTHTVYVRGMDIGKQWSAVQSATLTVQSLGYINGTVTSGGSPVSGVNVSTTGDGLCIYNGTCYTTGTDGKYSLNVPANSYDVTASKQPEYYDNTTTGVVVSPSNTTVVDIVIVKKPTGTISGVVTNA